MGERSHYLPRASVLDAMSEMNRWSVLSCHLRDIEDEISGFRSGDYMPTGNSAQHFIQLAQARKRRLIKIAQSYGLWLDAADAA